MKLLPTQEEKAAIRRMREADKALRDYCRRVGRTDLDPADDPEYMRLNDAANAAAKKVPFRFGGPRR